LAASQKELISMSESSSRERKVKRKMGRREFGRKERKEEMNKVKEFN
jgi:hypothetical protein